MHMLVEDLCPIVQVVCLAGTVEQVEEVRELKLMVRCADAWLDEERNRQLEAEESTKMQR